MRFVDAAPRVLGSAFQTFEPAGPRIYPIAPGGKRPRCNAGRLSEVLGRQVEKAEFHSALPPGEELFALLAGVERRHPDALCGAAVPESPAVSGGSGRGGVVRSVMDGG